MMKICRSVSPGPVLFSAAIFLIGLLSNQLQGQSVPSKPTPNAQLADRALNARVEKLLKQSGALDEFASAKAAK